MILLYLESSGSKLQSVNTKTSQFSPFFGFQELRKNSFLYIYKYIYIYIKYIYIYINIYIYIFPCVYYMILLYLEGSGSKF